jgi:hypothetical protein
MRNSEINPIDPVTFCGQLDNRIKWLKSGGRILFKNLSLESFATTQNKVRTAPLWGVRLRSQLMYDGQSVALRNAILRHLGEAVLVTEQFRKLKRNDQEAVIEFLRSLKAGVEL